MNSLNVFSELTKLFESVNGQGADAFRTESAVPVCQVFNFPEPAVVAAPAKHAAVDDLVATWEKNDARRLALEEARRWAAEALHAGEGETVRTLRLRKGWSQAALALKLGTSQPHIARIERGTENVAIDTCRRLAGALDVDMNTLDSALRRQEELGGQSKRRK